MKYTNVIKLSTLLIVFTLFLTGCGDDPASTFEEDLPEFPEFESISADLSYYEQNSQFTDQENTSNFTEAYIYVMGPALLATSGLMHTTFFSPASQAEAEFIDGEWRWEYSYSFEGESISVVLTAREVGDDIAWKMNWSYDDGQGNSYEDYTMIEGSTAKDGSSGSWMFNSFFPNDLYSDQEEPYMETTWESSGDDNFESTTEIYVGVTETQTYTYTRNGDVFDMTYSGSNMESSIYVHWNTSTGTGYYQEGTDTANRYCWNDDFTNVECSTVGY